MAPQFSAAELFRSPRLDAAAPKQIAQKSCNDFQRYLDDARSDLATSDKPSETPAPWDSETASEKARREGDEPESDDASQQVNAAVETPTDTVPFVIVGVSSIQDEQTPDVSATGSDSTTELPGKPSPLPPGFCPTRPFSHLSTGPIVSTTTKPMPGVPLPATPTVGPVSQDDASLQSSSDASKSAGKVNTEAHELVNTLPAQSANVSGETQDEAPTNVAQIQASISQNLNLTKGSGKAEPKAENDNAANKNKTQSEAGVINRADARTLEPENDSIQKQKMILSTQQANQVAVQTKNNSRPVSNKPDQHPSPTINALNLESRLSNDVVATESQPLSVISAKGDQPAVTIARFLMLGPQEDATANTPNYAGANITAIPHATTTNGELNFGRLGNLTAPQQALDSPLEQKNSLDSAVRLMQANKNGGKFQVTLQIDPPQLGPIKLQIQMRDKDMTMQVDTQTHGVARLMESRLSELRDALASHGITIDRADITVRATEQGDAARHKHDQSQAHNSGHRASDWGQHFKGSDDPGHHSWRDEQYGWSWMNSYGADVSERMGARDLIPDPLIETENTFLGYGPVNLIA